MNKAFSRRHFRTGFRRSFELLETRLTPSTFTVANLNDGGMDSLRQAILDANSNNGPDVIDFSVAGTIQLTSGALPAVTDQVIIGGKSAPGFTGAPVVEIDNNGFAGLSINASDSTLASLSIVNAHGAGVTLAGGSITVVGNYVGLAVDGSVAANQGNGITVLGSGNTIGGTAAGTGNVISGNSLNGILVQNPTTTGTVIQGNFIGSNAAGSTAVPNLLDGIFFQTVGSATIGGSIAGSGNLISGNKSNGIEISALLAVPQLVAPSTAGTGSLPASPYFYVVTATTAQGETTASNEQTVTLAAPGSVTLNWSAVPGAASYKVYRGTAGGKENVLAATVFTPATTFNDTGAPTTPGTPPTNNTAVVTDLAPSTVQGNKIGTDVTGTVALGNLYDGIQINQMPGASIGGTAAGARNQISGNGGAPDSGNGIHLIGAATTGTVIQGNFIGTDVTGGRALANAANGILLEKAVNITIGGTIAGAGNIVSANAFVGGDEAGINLIDHANNNTIVGNLIGTDVTGLVNLGNGGPGIRLGTGSSSNTIGGSTTAQRNVISGNGFGPFGPGAGILITGSENNNYSDQANTNVVAGNFIGVDITGGKALGNNLAGIAILDRAYANTIGGTSAGAGNVISGNGGTPGSGRFGDGLFLSQTYNTSVLGNKIGVDVTGLAAVPNAGNGVHWTQGSFSNVLGAPGAGNLISGNGSSGILVSNFWSSSLIVKGNAIGVDATRTKAIANQHYGIEVTAGAWVSLGAADAGAGNVISGNLAGGVSLNGYFPPPMLAGPTLGLGGALPAGTYYYVITATNASGETTPSVERTLTLRAPGAVVLNWAAVGLDNSGITGYKIYRGTSAGAENVLVANVSGQAMTSFTDAGGPTTPATPPLANSALYPNGAGASLIGNIIGLNGTESSAIPNGVGVLIVQASGGIGDYQPESKGNVISGNLGDGIRVSGSAAIASVYKNFIGTASNGRTSFPNGANGVVFESGANTGTSTMTYNVIQNNVQDGVLVKTGSTDVGISGNSIFNNGNLGIELKPGANGDLQAPVITSVYITQGNTLVQGTVTGPANTSLGVQLFASPSAPSVGPGQGLTLLGGVNVVTDASGHALFSVTLTGTAAAGQFVTGTTTQSRQVSRYYYNSSTSEFSAGVKAVSDPLAVFTIKIYQDVLSRSPSQPDIHFWTGLVNSGVSRLVVAQGVWESPEHRTIEVSQYYERYLFRAPDPGALTYWVAQMQAGLSEAAVQINLLASAEFGVHYPTATDYVTGLYNRVFNRVPTQADVQTWVNVAALGVTRTQLAGAFLTSPEEYAALLNTYYPNFLHRTPDLAGATYFLNALATGLAPQSVAEAILASDEYFARASAS